MNFFAGVLLAELLMSSAIKRKIVPAVSCVILGGTAVGACLFGLEALPGDMRWSVTGICAALISLTLYRDGSGGILTWPPIQMIGSLSLSIYLWHIPVVRWFLVLESKMGLTVVDDRRNFMAYFVVLMIASAASWHCLEKTDWIWKKERPF